MHRSPLARPLLGALAGFLLTLLAPPLSADEQLPLLSRPLPTDAKATLELQDWRWLRDKRELRLGIGADLPPFDITSSGRDFEGLTADVAGVIADKLGIDIKVLRFRNREEALLALVDGRIDLLSASNTYETANRQLLLSDTYAPDQPVLVSRDDERRPLSPGLNGMHLVMPADYQPLEKIRAHYPLARVSTEPDPRSALRAVALGRADLYLGDLVMANYLLNQTQAGRLRLAGYSKMPSSGFGFAMRSDQPELLKVINAALASIPPERQGQLLKRWSGGNGPLLSESNLVFTQQEQRWLLLHPVLRIATFGNLSPVSFFDSDGNYHGITADVLDQVRMRTGLRFEIIRTSSQEEMVEKLKAGEADLIGAFNPAASTTDDLAYTRPYMNAGLVIVTRRSDTRSVDLESLNGKRVALPRTPQLVKWLLASYPRLVPLEYDSMHEALTITADGGADAAILPGTVAEHLVQRFFDERLWISDVVPQQLESTVFALRRGDLELLSVLDKTLVNIPPDELAVLVNQRWRSTVEVAKPAWRDYERLIYQVSGVVGLLLSVSLIWNAYLRRQMKLRASAERALNDQLQLMETLINGTPHPIYVRDRDNHLLLCNDNYLEALSIEREQAIGAPPLDGLFGDDSCSPQMLEDYHAVMESGQGMQADHHLSQKGEPFSIYHWIEPFRDSRGIIRGVVGGWIDITERLRLVADLQEAKERADEASRAKSTFLATMSHEIRTPMNAVIGMLELALQRADQDHFDRQAIEIAHDSANNLLELIGNILDIARIESGRINLSPVRCNLREEVEAVVRVFDGLARQKSLALRLEFDPKAGVDVLLDPLRFKQVLSNLVSNAIKFTERGRVTLKVAAQAIANKRLELTLLVEDSGQGIEPEDLERLFQPFSQGQQQPNNTIGGTGLGLVISRTLCEMMGGSIEMTSRPGHGTCVTVELALQILDPLPRKEASPVAQIAAPQQSLDVLVVDDHPANRELLKQQLIFLGHRVNEAHNGASGLELWQRQQFDLVISDCNMPIMNGYDLARAVRNLERRDALTPCRFIGYTANAQNEEHERCRQAGMDACLFKPISLGELAAQLVGIAPRAVLTAHMPAACNLKEFERLAGRDPALRMRLLDTLLDSNRNDMALMQGFLDDGDRQAIAEVAHKIKGAAKIVHAGPLIACCESLEALCEAEGSEDELLAEVAALRAELERLEHSLLGEMSTA
ncbi:hybrid sensor histidine kinase/response regulator [Pseudomonas solani]|uniref:histidine kinase n=1 Tax=Pseudomonas solani TaxID=2731552 RepID=A0ABM7L4I9_9PSED|nr:transporter substrate-binding domain-containing protein [Pseudomonas solani]BCD84469.1 hybrid sensor histidine kinase/response regulator [Pseudomonas solani]